MYLFLWGNFIFSGGNIVFSFVEIKHLFILAFDEQLEKTWEQNHQYKNNAKVSISSSYMS